MIMQEGGVTKANMPEGCIWPDVPGEKINFKDMGDCPVPDIKNKTWELIYWDILKFFQEKSQSGNKNLEDLIKQVIDNGFSVDVPSGEDCDVDTSEMQNEIDKLDQTIKSAFLRTQKAGNAPAGLNRYVDDFGKSRVPWTEKFRNILRTKPFIERIDNRPNSKHIHITGIPTMPKFVGERMDAMWLVFDTSGSIQPEDIQEGVDEIHGLRQASNAELFVTSCDTQVYDVVKYDVYDYPSADELPIKGGGGTDFRPIFEKVEEYMTDGKCEKPSVLVLVTDTYGPFPEKDPGYFTVVLVPSTVGRYWGGNGNYSVPEWAELVVMED
jgi:predicted metal-dependent peptidase